MAVPHKPNYFKADTLSQKRRQRRLLEWRTSDNSAAAGRNFAEAYLVADEPVTPEAAKTEIAALRRALSAGWWDLAHARRIRELSGLIAEQDMLAERLGRRDLVDQWRECRWHWEGLYAMTLVRRRLSV
jgi:hypothetical protein